jgi:hypothetical protein
VRIHHSGFRQAADSLGFAFEPLAQQADALPPEHPFARVLDLLRVWLRQSLATAVALIAVVGSATLGAEWAHQLLVPAFIVQVGTLVGVAVVTAIARGRAEDLIAEGRGNLDLPILTRQRKRLLEHRRREALARAFEGAVRAAARGQKILRAYRPVFNLQLVREAEQDLFEIAALLRTDIRNPRGIVLAKRLLTDGSSPLYGTDRGDLRDSLGRIRSSLADGDCGA